MRLVWVVIPLVLFGIVGISESFAEENSSIIYENDLEFSVMTDKKHYHDDEIIHIFWHVKNIGNRDISYTTSSTCNDGFSWSITNSEIQRVNGVLGESANLIKEDDSTVLKFENPGFYGDILQSIKDEPNKTRDILIFTSNGEKLVNILKEKFEVVKYSEPKSEPDAIGARVSVKYIPEIANMELVTSILEGDAPVCGSAELTKVLEPNEIIDGNFSWSQLVNVKDNRPQNVSDGYYSIGVIFDNISNCVMFGINADDTLSENMSCGFGIQESFAEEDTSIPPLTRGMPGPTLRITDSHGNSLDHLFVNEKVWIDFDISNGYDEEQILSYHLEITNSQNELIHTESLLIPLLPYQTFDEDFSWIPKDLGDHTVTAKVFTNAVNSDWFFPFVSTTIEVFLNQESFAEKSQLYFSPKKQLELGIAPENVVCNDGLQLIFKSSNNSPACVKPETAEKLIERGWANIR